MITLTKEAQFYDGKKEETRRRKKSNNYNVRILISGEQQMLSRYREFLPLRPQDNPHARPRQGKTL